MSEQELSAWLSLCLTPGVSNKNIRRLLQLFGNAALIFQDKAYRHKIKQKEILRLVELCRAYWGKPETKDKIKQALIWQQDKAQHIITLHCDNYPPLLKEIPDPPLLLYVIGSLEALALPQIAMVGSRKASPGGRAIAKRLAGELAAGGYSVCSGLALGIDAESHSGALENQGKTIAILGSGIDQIYPRSSLKLAELLAINGALVSEFPLGAPPLPGHFPQRNRIISGMSQGVVVVEAALQSGSLITARYALEQGREVFAVPGSVHNPQSKGCHYLLKNGAKLVENVRDITEELGAFIENEHEQLSSKADKTKNVNKAAQALLQYIDYEVTNIDRLIYQTGINAELIGSLLIELELQGLIISRCGGYSLAPS